MKVDFPPIIRQPIFHIDATPDAGYVLRILRAYRGNCDCLWTDNTGGEETTNPLIIQMNGHQRERAELLDKAIAMILRTEKGGDDV